MTCVKNVARVVVAFLLVSGAAMADIHAPWPTDWNNWNDPALWVTVGNPGNLADPETGYGAVAYTFNIGKFEVTAGQYTEFLNAVAKTDTYGLYSTNMLSDTYGCKIERSGSSGSYTYGVASDRANRPVSYVSWGDAARFANWLTHGQPTGAQDLTTTEDGSYYLNGAITHEALLAVTRKTPEQGGRYYVPTEDEWYKAAYHKNDGVTGNYFDYPTGSDSVPGRDLSEVTNTGNNANYDVTPDGNPFPIDSGTYYTTVPGEFQLSDSPYGTFDQGGNIWEWDEAILSGTYRGRRGGSFYYYSRAMLAGRRDNSATVDEYSGIGFRVSQVPEPATLALLAFGSLLLLRRRGER